MDLNKIEIALLFFMPLISTIIPILCALDDVF